MYDDLLPFTYKTYTPFITIVFFLFEYSVAVLLILFHIVQKEYIPHLLFALVDNPAI